MSSKVTLDRAGRVVLPKAPLQKERGVWVFRTGKPLTADETEATLRDIRAKRHRRNAGEQP